MVYDADSGDTHAMGRTGLLLLEALRSQPESYEELQARGQAAAQDFTSGKLDQLLDAWEQLGLIEVVAGPDTP